MTTTEIKELFELTAQRVAKIEAETTQKVAKIEAETTQKVAQIRKEAESIRKETEGIRKETEGIRKKNDEETAQIRKKNDEETAQIRKEAESIRKETEDIRKETEDIRKEARKLAEEDFSEIRKILNRTERNIEKTSGHLGFYTKKVANISEEYFYRGLKSNISVGGMTFDTIVRNIDIDGKEYDIILENDNAVMLVSVKTTINSDNVREDLPKDIVILKNSSRYKSTNKKFYATIAGFTGGDHKHILSSAKKKGIFVLALSEEHQPTLVNAEVSPTVY